MSFAGKDWRVAHRLPPEYFERFPGVPRLVAQILHNRGLDAPLPVRQFLALEPSTDTEPFRLKDMHIAVARLQEAIRKKQPITVYGDYDADGVTATALMLAVLQSLGAQVQGHIPDRFTEGYGLNKDSIGRLAQQGTQVLLTVDCGIRSESEVKWANQLGLDVILTDHHGPGAELPPAMAIINPKQAACHYPFTQLAGVGLAYKLSQALLQTVEAPAGLDPDGLLDLVALGTVADLAPLLDENRSLVARGIERINHNPRLGIRKLMEKAGIRPGTLDAERIGFGLGPRLNAAGRLSSAQDAFRLLVTEDEAEADQLADRLDELNRQRQDLTREAVERARAQIKADRQDSRLYLLADEDLHPGVVGLVSGRLTEEFYVPTLVAQRGQEFCRGSARSIPGFHITQALDACSDLLERYGGHSMAAGFTVRNENWLSLEARLLEFAGETLESDRLTPMLDIDAEINLRGFDRSFLEDAVNKRSSGLDVPPDNQGLQILDGLDSLRPFGTGNPAPVFVSRGLRISGKRLVGGDRQHLSLELYDGKQVWKGIAFRQADWLPQLTNQVDVVYEFNVNHWQNRQGTPQIDLQLMIQDIQPAG